MADIQLAGNEHFGFKLYKNSLGVRIYGVDANGSLSFELAQLRIGPDKVPLSLVFYIDATFMKNGIPVRPIYGKYYMRMSHVILYVTSHIFWQWAVSTTIGVSCQNCMLGGHWPCFLF